MNIKIKNENLFNIRRDIGVYIIRCIPLDRIYIGSTNQTFRARFSNHCKFLNQGTLGNTDLQEDFNNHGAENFEFEILGVYPEHLTVYYENLFVDSLKPFYNKNKPCNNSKTNQGKKFTKEHIEKLRKKSKLFKHNDLDFIAKQNKKGANKFLVKNIKTGEVHNIESKVELSKFLDIKHPQKYYNKNYKDYYIKVLKTQKKSVKLFIENEWVTFTSYEKCDKFLNKWRGYTSTKSLKKVNKLDDYLVEFC